MYFFDVVTAAFDNELAKLAAPRFEKEIAKGTIARGDVTPGVPGGTGFGMLERAASRSRLAAPAPVQPAALQQRRDLNGKLYEAQKARPGDAMGLRRVKTINSNAAYATPAMGGYVIGMPERGAGHSPPLPVENTVNRAVLQHEFGEVNTMSGGVVRPVATHAGVEPILREHLHARGDPQAIDILNESRLHPDEDIVQKAIKQVGGTADAPLAIGGRQQRAVEKILDRNVSKLAPATRLRAVFDSTHNQVPYLPKSPVDKAKFTLQAAKELGTKALKKVIR